MRLHRRNRRRDRSHRLIALALAAFFGATPPAPACDDVLLALVQGSQAKTQFDERLEKIATLLRTSGDEAKKGDWDATNTGFVEIQRLWVETYSEYLTRPPPGFEKHPDWQGLLTSFSPGIRALGEHIRNKDGEAYHDQSYDTHAQLMQLYMDRNPATVALALRILAEPVERILKTGLAPIARPEMPDLLDLTKTRLESLIPRAPNSGTADLGKKTIARMDEIMKKGAELEEKALRAELVAVLQSLESFRASFPAPAPGETPAPDAAPKAPPR